MRSRFLRPLLAVAFAAGLVSAGLVQAQTQVQAPLSLISGPLYRQLAAIKGMASAGSPPPVLMRNREETRRFIEQELDRRYSAERVESERKGMVAWGLIPPDYDLRRLFVDLMEEQTAAYYDPRQKVMVVGDWLPPEQQQAALMHELVHALQDREVSLDAFLSPTAGQGDQVLARQALIEGEAVALTLELVLRTQGMDFASVPDLSALQGIISAATMGPAVDSAPKFLRDLLIFPYVGGVSFLHEWRKRQPWAAMASLYRDPPRSSTQIMNPAKHLVAREDPIPIRLPDLGPLAGTGKVVAEDELGEFALGAVLGLHLGEAAGRSAALGWRGDHYRAWEESDGRLVMVYLLALDSERAADSFARIYADVLEKRHPALAGKRTPGGAGSAVAWRDGDRAFVVERRGAEVLALERVPAATSDRAREVIWRSRGTGPSRP